MAKEKPAFRKNIPVPSLIIPRTEAESRIYGRITSGKKLLGLSIRSERDLEAAKNQRKKWNDDNEALLKKIFDSEAIVKDYTISLRYDGHLMNTSWRQRISGFYESISTQIAALESIIERLELIPEKVIISKTQKRHEAQLSDAVSVVQDHDKKSHEPVIEKFELIPEKVVASEVKKSHESVTSSTVFIIRGHDEEAESSVVEFVEKLGLKTVVIHGQTDTGQAIIEKFERGAPISEYAVVILTPDDMGVANDDPDDATLRSRHNVIFELGYFCGVLGRGKISILVKEGLKIPVDNFGIASILMDPGGAWQFSLAKNMKSAGLSFDANRIFY